MAAKVMRMPEPDRGAGEQGSRGAVGTGLVPAQLQKKTLLQREAIPEEKEDEKVQMKSAVQREVMPEEEEEEEETLQAKPQIQAKGGTPEVPGNFEGQLASHRGGGQPLSDETRAFMEPRFGTDFSGVRVHNTPDLANAIQAQAFTHGQDIYFNSGKYNPGSSGGKELLAHELTHVVQQSGKPNVTPVQRDPVPQSNASSKKNVKILCQTWNVREKPSLSATKIEPPLTYGARVKLIKEVSENWLKVDYQGRDGYVYRKPWIKVESATPDSTQPPVPENRYRTRLVPPLRNPAAPLDLSVHLEPEIPLEPGLPDWFWKKLPPKPKQESFIKLVSGWLTEKLGRSDIARIASKLAGKFGFNKQKIRQSLNEKIIQGGEKGIEKLLRKLLESILGKAEEINNESDPQIEDKREFQKLPGQRTFPIIKIPLR